MDWVSTLRFCGVLLRNYAALGDGDLFRTPIEELVGELLKGNLLGKLRSHQVYVMGEAQVLSTCYSRKPFIRMASLLF